MRISITKPAGVIYQAGLAIVLSAFVCFGQSTTQPAAKSAAKPPAPSHHTVAAKGTSPSQKVVLTVGTTKVTKAEMDYVLNNMNPRTRESQGVRGVGERYAMMLLLSQQAINDHLESSPGFRLQLKLTKNQLLAGEEYRKLEAQASVSPEEISAYYNAHKSDFEEASIRLFRVRKKAEGAKPDDPGLSPADAKARLASIQKAIASGKDIADVAKQFDVPNVVAVESEPSTVRRGQLPPALDQAAFKLADNQFSAPVETPNVMIELQLLSRKQADLKDVSHSIENALRQEKVKVALDDLKSKAHITLDPDYFKESAAQGPSKQAAP